jgi:hypothetical protein
VQLAKQVPQVLHQLFLVPQARPVSQVLLVLLAQLDLKALQVFKAFKAQPG